MLQKKPYKILFVAIILAVGLVLASRYFGSLGFNYVVFQKPFTWLYNNSQILKRFGSGVYNWRNLVSENEILERENIAINQRLADYKNLQSENQYLRKSLGLKESLNKELIYANIFSEVIGANEAAFLINKGQDAGISKDMVVTTEEGILIGKISEARDHYSRVMTVRDRNFRITARTQETNISGIAEGALINGMYLKLVIQSENIKEGELLVSSGDDFFPSALIIGKIQNIESSQGDTFKIVRVKPMFESLSFARVVIIK